MRKALFFLALLFCLFPYTQIIPLESYNQPYAIFFSTLAAIAAIPLVQRAFLPEPPPPAEPSPAPKAKK